nr:ABC transporter permease subunit [Acidipropionibacterium jensenii]
MGAGEIHVLATQLLPNLVATIIVFTTISIPGKIGAEAALSFLGVGVIPPTPSWGRTIGSAVTWVSTDPWYLLFPGAALFLVTLAFNLFGDGLRDAIDPRSGEARWIAPDSWFPGCSRLCWFWCSSPSSPSRSSSCFPPIRPS